MPPAAAAVETGRLPTAVPGAPPRLPWPASGQAALATTSGVSFGASGSDRPVPIASLTKVMTAYVVLADHPLAPGASGPYLVVGAGDAGAWLARKTQGQSVLPVTAGEHLSELQALEALLVPSADNIARLLSVYDSGTEAAFVSKMNRTARALGMSHTVYADPSGLDPASRSTPADQIKLAEAALRVPVLAAVVAMPSVTLPEAGTVDNYNTLLGGDGFEGVKTGSTNAAGGCLMFAATRTIDTQAVTVVGAVLDQRGGPYVAAAVRAARALTDAAFAALAPRAVLPAGTAVVRVGAAGQHTFAVTTTALTSIDPPGTPVTLSVSPPGLPATVAGTTVATVTLHAPDTTETTTAEIREPLPAPSLVWRLHQLL